MNTPATVAPASSAITLPINTTTRISTKDIAEQVEKNHKHIMRDVKSLIEQGALRESSFGLSHYDVPMPNNASRKAPMYLLDFHATMTLITGYNAVLRSKVITRWMELEQAAQPSTPTLPEPTITPAEQNRLQQAIRARFDGRTNLAYAWSRFNNHFQLGSYKQLPSSRVEEALDYIERMPIPGEPEGGQQRQQPERITEPGLYTFVFKGQPLAVHIDSNEAIWFRLRDLGRILGYYNPTSGLKMRLTDKHETLSLTVTINSKYTRNTLFVAADGLEHLLTHTWADNLDEVVSWVCDEVAPAFGLRFASLCSKNKGKDHLQLQGPGAVHHHLPAVLPVPAPEKETTYSASPRGKRFLASLDDQGRMKMIEIEPDAFVATLDTLPGMLKESCLFGCKDKLPRIIETAVSLLAGRRSA